MTLETMQWHESVSLNHGQDDYRRTSLIRLVSSFVTGEEVLDMRALTGDLAVELAERGFQVTALDGYQGAVDLANARARAKGIMKELARLWNLSGLNEMLGENHFDTVLCLDLLNHVADDTATVREIARVLKPNGRLILTAPAYPGLKQKRDEKFGHLRRYEKSKLVALLQKEGLSVDSIRYWNFLALPVYFLIERILKKRISDDVRYMKSKWTGRFAKPLLRWWYQSIENRIHFPWGLSFFVIAHKDATST